MKGKQMQVYVLIRTDEHSWEARGLVDSGHTDTVVGVYGSHAAADAAGERLKDVSWRIEETWYHVDTP